MKFRIVYIGNTRHIKELKAAAQEFNPTARSQWLGICFPDDAIEAEVESVEEGKKLMAHLQEGQLLPEEVLLRGRPGMVVQRHEALPRHFCLL